ncbi:EAL domain-containing protein [Cellulomonas sp. ATA003]|uniref:putative bifunctional diguanylate cyclase/phosphodiesterase n=1 Tax=Cellulomonas sp. ATA003 TaxID=3073064 RepID=UPI0028731E7A|nr:EAL domain-containing protein [Cellulomonas sp. ATA003]WNB87467.1 EAL domain-containing protein [Cellulomonas sp. ATA003]
MTRQATHDVLTGLPNRGLFHERVRQALARSRDNHPAAPSTDRRDPRTRPTIAVLFCDLDGFKAVNDSLGHRAGDDLLVEVARRLRTTLRQDDVVARLGGDEFAVLVLDTDRAGASAVAERLLAALEETVEVAGRGVHVGISIGITLAEPDSDADADRLVREADVAMYEAKAAGRGRCVVFSPVMLATQVEHASLVQDLHGAVSRGEIFVEYQPIVDLTTGRVDGVEALARWAHPERGPVSPAIFVPLGEQAGLIDEIGARVLAEVRADAESFAAAAGRPVSIGVNVSARELTRSRVLDLIDAGRTSSAQLIAEVTESTLLRPDVVPLLAELRRSGVRIAMDDFGVGQSSIAALRLMPADIIKLDRAFTVDVATDPRALAIVRAVVRMASELEVALVAEGIETTEQREALMALGCRFGQGFLLARPMGARAMRDHLRAASSPAAEADAEAETDADAGPSRGVDVLPQQRDGSAAHSTAPPRTRR